MNKMIAKEDLDHIFAHTDSLWESMRNKRIFITGGTGFIGKWLLEGFNEANTRLDLHAEATLLSRNPEAFIKDYPHLGQIPGIYLQKGDIQNFNFPEESFDFLIHGATEASARLNEENPLMMIDTILSGTRRILEFAQLSGVKRLLFLSSGAVYGRQPPHLTHVPEDHIGAPDPTQPLSAYGEAKRIAELLCSVYRLQYGIETSIARCFAFVGPYLNLDIHYAIGNFIRDGLEQRTIQIKGDGTPYRSYMYAADLTIWLWTILFKAESGKVYNVGSDQEISISDLAGKIRSLFEKPLEVSISQSAAPGQLPARYIPNIERAKKELGLKCWIDLDEAIYRTIRFYRQ